jgi:hypothetical protein
VKRELPEGARVKFRHERLYDNNFVIANPRGGKTIATIVLPDGTEVTGESRCSKKDNYSKRLGRDISLGRALASLEKGEQE